MKSRNKASCSLHYLWLFFSTDSESFLDCPRWAGRTQRHNLPVFHDLTLSRVRWTDPVRDL